MQFGNSTIFGTLNVTRSANISAMLKAHSGGEFSGPVTITGSGTIGTGQYDMENSWLRIQGASQSIGFDDNEITSDGILYIQAATSLRLGTGAANGNLVMDEAGNTTLNGGTIWHSANDGSGSGLDADLWDGYQLSTRSNWRTNNAQNIVVGQLAWQNYNNSHTIFDASSGVTPSGTTCDKSNPSVNWTTNYPTLMGWNGSNTYGVRVDRARYAEDADTLDGMQPTSGNTASTIVSRDSSGNFYTNTRIYFSNGDILRYDDSPNIIYLDVDGGTANGKFHNADLLDGQHASAFATASHSHSELDRKTQYGIGYATTPTSIPQPTFRYDFINDSNHGTYRTLVNIGGYSRGVNQFSLPYGHYGDGDDFYWRVHNWGSDTWNPWYRIWHSGNMPKVTTASSAPSSPATGDLWVDTSA